MIDFLTEHGFWFVLGVMFTFCAVTLVAQYLAWKDDDLGQLSDGWGTRWSEPHDNE